MVIAPKTKPRTACVLMEMTAELDFVTPLAFPVVPAGGLGSAGPPVGAGAEMYSIIVNKVTENNQPQNN